MTVMDQLPAMDNAVYKLDNQIGKHLHIKRKLEKRIEWINRKIEYRNQCIRELSAKRTESLNFTLPL